MNSKSGKPLLEVRGLKKHFNVSKGWFNRNPVFLKAVDGVDLTIFQGETFGIVGESGCGKSTLGSCLLRLSEPTAGEIVFEGQDLLKLSPREMRSKRKEFQMVFQDPYSSLNPRMRVFDIVAEPFRSNHVAEGQELQNKVTELMEIVGLSKSHLNRYPHEFSGGQRQRIGIARALALRPKLIVCDEAVSALDVSIQAQVLNLLAQLQKEFQLTYIFIGHGIPTVKHISDRIAVMYLGKIVEIGSKAQLFEKPLHPYTEGLLSAVPIEEPTLREKKERVLLTGDLPSPINPPAGCRFFGRCRYATEKCRTEEPELTALQNGHMVACHYPLSEHVKGARP